ncbi:MAG: hypothetical protein GY861_10355 [bacterium]|nr:hypothetical protein [bacterium]
MCIYKRQNLIISFLCIVFLTGCARVFAEPQSAKTHWRVYVWDFVSHNEKDNKLMETLTNEFEAALINTQCCDVLERREYSKLFEHISNEKAIASMKSISYGGKREFESIGANGVIFGKVYDETDKVKLSVLLQSFNGVKIASKSIRLSRTESNSSRELKLTGLANSLMDDYINKPVIIFQGIQHKHGDSTMLGVEERATELMANALSKSKLFEIIETPSGQKLNNAEAHKKYPTLKYLVSGTITGNTKITEITLKFTDVRKETVQRIKAFNITTTHIDYIITKLSLKINETFGFGKPYGDCPPKKKKKKIPKNRIVIDTFQSKTGNKNLDYIIGNISEILITGLIKIDGYVVVEKSQIERIYEEWVRTSDPFFDFCTTVERGRLWASEDIVVGSFQKEKNKILINARIVDLETGENKCAGTVSGSESELTALVNKLADNFKNCLK